MPLNLPPDYDPNTSYIPTKLSIKTDFSQNILKVDSPFHIIDESLESGKYSTLEEILNKRFDLKFELQQVQQDTAWISSNPSILFFNLIYLFFVLFCALFIIYFIN